MSAANEREKENCISQRREERKEERYLTEEQEQKASLRALGGLSDRQRSALLGERAREKPVSRRVAEAQSENGKSRNYRCRAIIAPMQSARNLIRKGVDRAERRRMNENEIGTSVVDAAIAVHRELGPGLLETVYEVSLEHELKKRGLVVKRQVSIPIRYQELSFDEGFRADLIVEDKVILELKSVEEVSGVHKKQIQTYLRLTGRKLGYLLNFGAALMKDGITRCVNGLDD